MSFHKRIYLLFGYLFLLVAVTCSTVIAQSQNCNFIAPLIKIDFGSLNSRQHITLNSIKGYKQSKDNCPDDGHFTFAAFTADCFAGNWHTVTEDHTPNDKDGQMMIVNASREPGKFFMLNIEGLKPGATYRFANWIMNICKSATGCIPTPPVIKVSILADGKILSTFSTGKIYPTTSPLWKNYSAFFTLPPRINKITLHMEDITEGGCGNDFALDDITLQECTTPMPVSREKEVDSPVKADKKIIKTKSPLPVVEKEVTIPPSIPVQNETPTIRKNIPAMETVPVKTEIKKGPDNLVIPSPITSRTNTVIKAIKVPAGNLLIQLYDNGQIDGDTISIYHNNQLIISNAGLSEKPIQFKILVNEQQRYHEIIMVANNLGSIPPNTSLMIITTTNKRYEIFSSSTEFKNAKLVIDLEE